MQTDKDDGRVEIRTSSWHYKLANFFEDIPQYVSLRYYIFLVIFAVFKLFGGIAIIGFYLFLLGYAPYQFYFGVCSPVTLPSCSEHGPQMMSSLVVIALTFLGVIIGSLIFLENWVTSPSAKKYVVIRGRNE